MDLSIVIPCKADEPHLMQTLESIERTAPGSEVIVVFDGCAPPENLPANFTAVMPEMPLGTQSSRHTGIMAAGGDVVFTCDAHMDFQPGWASQLRSYLHHEPDGLCCFKMVALEDGHDSWTQGRGVYKGAAMNWMVREDSGFHGALVGKWADNKPGDEISCVMGACYGMRRQRYLDLNQPWRLGTGWGCDEETISAVQWLCGGRIDLLDHYVGHYMGKPRHCSVDWVDQLWANRLRLLWMLPFKNATKVELVTWLTCNKAFAARLNKINAHAYLSSADLFRESTPWTRTIEDWIERFELKPRSKNGKA
ncbi:hypothetical protein PDESU_03327 [Pontiella desulfatans]|uniref:Glycosyltransferase 2-like domain-containing protein n=1 Tax=Pontiella desulfatans TaxID=2750659 RepID=A0A6C2U3X8_PONDE|nr:glycosyltransferase family A protein [Pontiella desulfatans]VGO14758.1 hypothetical protein PDESU_03327 [Pontiella desulfatans]